MVLVYDRYRMGKGSTPTFEQVREILMSSTDDLINNGLMQGAGRFNASLAPSVAAGLVGVYVSPSELVAGDKGEMSLRWILMNPDLNYKPVGFLDENPLIAGRQLHGVKVLGNPQQLVEFLKLRQVKASILAFTEGEKITERDMVDVFRSHHCWVMHLSLHFEEVEIQESTIIKKIGLTRKILDFSLTLC
jgi:hypothetical protein